jgi:hypothetical protein
MCCCPVRVLSAPTPYDSRICSCDKGLYYDHFMDGGCSAGATIIWQQLSTRIDEPVYWTCWALTFTTKTGFALAEVAHQLAWSNSTDCTSHLAIAVGNASLLPKCTPQCMVQRLAGSVHPAILAAGCSLATVRFAWGNSWGFTTVHMEVAWVCDNAIIMFNN